MRKKLQKSFVMLVFSILFIIGFGIKLQAQSVPSNDACANAILLTVYGTTGTSVTGDVAGATLSMAANCGGTAEDDVWYKFVALSTSQTITVVGSASFDAVVELLSGACMGRLELRGQP